MVFWIGRDRVFTGSYQRSNPICPMVIKFFLSVILAATSFVGCKGEEQITATNKDIPVYNEVADKITGTEQNVTQPSTENAPDMSEYIKKEDVEAL